MLSATGVLHRDILASPGTIAKAAGDLIADGTLPAAIGISLQRVAVGLLLGGVIGVALALVSGLSRLGGFIGVFPLRLERNEGVFERVVDERIRRGIQYGECGRYGKRGLEKAQAADCF